MDCPELTMERLIDAIKPVARAADPLVDFNTQRLRIHWRLEIGLDTVFLQIRFSRKGQHMYSLLAMDCNLVNLFTSRLIFRYEFSFTKHTV